MLNPALHARLLSLFPQGVRISHEDEPLVFGTRIDHSNVKRRWKEQAGESYNVCCPICGDERFRLSISYAWGLDKKERYPTSKLVNCYNERCQDNYDDDKEDRGNVQLWLLRRLRSSYLNKVADGDIIIKPVVRERRTEQAVPFPDTSWVSPLDLLPSAHPACVYIRDRGFLPEELYRKWGVVLCNQMPVEANGKKYDWLAGRLFIPTPGKGWQARAVDEHSKPKYFSCPGWKKSDHLYGINTARATPEYTLLCEGVTDVWRVDGPAVCVFGKNISTAQLGKLRRNWGLVGVLFDPDTEEDSVNSMRRAMNLLERFGIRPFRITLTGQKDAAMCDYHHLWDCIERSADTAGYGCVRRPNAR